MLAFFYLQFPGSTLGIALTKHEHQHSRGMEVCLRGIPGFRTECRLAGKVIKRHRFTFDSGSVRHDDF